MQERISELEQERISELEQERISELEQYLIATGLNDYELTDEDKKILATKLTDGGALQSSTSVNGCLKEVRSFKLDEIFFAESGDFDIKKEHINGLGIDVVTAGETNNGILGKSNIEAKIIDGNTITIDMFGKCTYRANHYKMVTHARVFSLKCLFDNFNEMSGLYIATVMQKLVNGFSYSNMCSWTKIKNSSINLPVKESGEIDWEYMEKYIKATEKVVIRDVVDWKDKMIEKTKEVVDCSDALQVIQPSDAQ